MTNPIAILITQIFTSVSTNHLSFNHEAIQKNLCGFASYHWIWVFNGTRGCADEEGCYPGG